MSHQKTDHLMAPDQFVHLKKKDILISPNSFIPSNDENQDSKNNRKCFDKVIKKSSKTPELLTPNTFSTAQKENIKLEKKFKDTDFHSLDPLQVDEKDILKLSKESNQNSFLLNKNEKPLAKTMALISTLKVNKAKVEMNLAETISELNDVKEQLQHCQVHVKSLSEENLKLKKEKDENERKHFDEIKKLYSSFFSTHSQVEKEKETFDKKLDDLSKSYDVQLSSQKVKLEEQNAIIDNLKIEINNLSNHICHKNTEIEKSKQINITLNEENESLTITKDNIANKLEHSVHHISVLKNEVAEKDKLLNEKESLLKLKESENSLNADIQNKSIQTLQSKIDDLMLQNKKESERSNNYQCLFEELSSKVKDYEKEKQADSTTKIRLAEAYNKIDLLKIEIGKKQKVIDELQETYSTLENSNKLLHVRYESLSELQNLQNSLDPSQRSIGEELLLLWRKKVFQMLVLWKTHQLECKK